LAVQLSRRRALSLLSPERSSGWRTPLSYGLIAVVATLLSLVRLPTPAIGTLWAEDGGIFVNDVIKNPGLRNVFAPYQGYLHVVPRGIAWVVVKAVPVEGWAVAVTVAACLIVGLVAVLVFHCSSELSKSVWVRLGFAAVPVLVASGPEEALGTLANLHWYFLYLAPWLLLKRPRTTVEITVLTVAALLVGLTEIQAAMFVPMFVYRLRDVKLWGPRLALLAGVGAQVFTTLAFPRHSPDALPPKWLSVFYAWFVEGPSAVVFGTAGQVSRVVIRFGWVPVAFAAAIFVGAVFIIFIRGGSRDRVAAGAFFGGSVVAACSAVALNFTDYFDYAGFDQVGWGRVHLGRYAVVPSMFLLALFPLVGEVLGRAARVELLRRTARTATVSVAAVLMLVYFFPVSVGREFGPVWRDGVDQGQTACQTPGGGPTSIIPIAPTGWLYKGVTVPCGLLD
jgi:hypothetical protein